MKILFAVMSAETYIFNGMDQLIRDTWAKDAQNVARATFKFFCGRGETVLPADYVRVDAPDDKDNLTYKVEKMCLWAYEQGYDMMLKTDIDTYVNVPLIMQQDLGYDWIGAPIGMLGQMYGNTGAFAWVQGSAMWLSATAMRSIYRDIIPHMQVLMPKLMKANGIISPYPHNEDLWIGQVLGPFVKVPDCIRALEDTRYSNGPLTYHFAICHSTCTQEEWRRRLENWFYGLHRGSDKAAVHESR